MSVPPPFSSCLRSIVIFPNHGYRPNRLEGLAALLSFEILVIANTRRQPAVAEGVPFAASRREGWARTVLRLLGQ
jgi:hypothetical protein